MSAETIWLIGLMITHACAYFMGKTDRTAPPLDRDARIEVEKYQIDKFYEFEHWKVERSCKHGDENA